MDSSFIPATQFGKKLDFDFRFPPLPKTVTEVSIMLAELLDPPDTLRLASVVGTDPIVANFVLRRVNSAHYGLRRKVDNVRQAVMLLGFREVCNITLTAGMMRLKEVVSSDEQAAIFKEVMRLSIGAAFFAQELATYLRLPLRDKAFIVGLQHAVGRLVLLYNRPEDYEALWFTSNTLMAPLPDDERKIFGIDHAGIGALAIDHWELPALISQIVQSYITPMHLNDHDLRTLGLALSVAVSAAEQLGPGLRNNSPVSEASGPVFFTPSTNLHLLAKLEEVASVDLIQVIRTKQSETSNYIQAMMQG